MVAALHIRVAQPLDTPQGTPEDRPGAVVPEGLGEEPLGDTPPQLLAFEVGFDHRAQELPLQCFVSGLQDLEGVIPGRRDELVESPCYFPGAALSCFRQSFHF